MKRPTPPYRSLIENPKWAKVQCERCGVDFWLEPGLTPSSEYPYIKIKGDNMRVSRFMLEQHLGRPIRDGLYALHSCDNTRCVNPTHLHEGTQKQNKEECVERGRQQDMRGEDNPHSKLTEDQVKYIRENPDGLTGRDLAAMFEVNESCTSSIKNYRLWKHI